MQILIRSDSSQRHKITNEVSLNTFTQSVITNLFLNFTHLIKVNKQNYTETRYVKGVKKLLRQRLANIQEDKFLLRVPLAGKIEINPE